MRLELKDLPPDMQKQVMDQMAQNVVERQERVKTGKYRNKPTERKTESGSPIRFPSQAEARRYDELMLMLKAGAICDLRLQQEFTLQEAYTTPDGVRIKAERYKADFTYYRDGKFIVEDVKGMKGGKGTRTRLYASKKKRVLDKYGIRITEVE